MSNITGTSDDDLLFVRTNGDLVYGLAGDDLLITEERSFARLYGGAGGDILAVFFRGQLAGGEGNDRFDLIHTGAEAVITDFQQGPAGSCALHAEDVLNVGVDAPFDTLAGTTRATPL